MTTEQTAPTPAIVPTPEQELATVKANLEKAQSELDAARAAFANMMANPGSVAEPEAQMAIFAAVQTGQTRVANLTSTLENTEKKVRLAVLEEPAKTLREHVKDALDSLGIGAMMANAGAGGVIAITCSYNTPEGGEPNWSVSSRFPGQAVTSTSKPAATDGAEPATRGRLTIVTPDGEFTSKDYIFRYWEAAKSAGYKTTRATADVVPANEYAKIAPVIAAKLGHTIK